MADPPGPAPPPRFVVLEHRWDGVHWDLMLESEGALRTWALSAFPTVGEDIPANALPDHRIAYLDYEGPISGNRGSVRRVDRGSYEPILWRDDRVVVRFRGDQVIGPAELDRVSDLDWRLRIGKFI
jgi:hypothetical protein